MTTRLHTAARGAATLLVIGALSGCTFSREYSNGAVRDLDPGPIVAGETTRLEAIQHLGLPPPDFPEEMGTRVVAADYIRYGVYERRCFTIGLQRILVITPFRWCSDERVYELALEFDTNGIVSSVTRSSQGVPWRPFQSTSRRAMVSQEISP